MEQQFGVTTTLQKGRDGVFEISLDGELIFSKKAVGRFPDPGEVARLVEERAA